MKKTLRMILCAVLLCCLMSIAAATKGLPFTDVKAKDWYNKAVTYVYQNQMMSGVSDTRFAPNESLTRAMFVTILGRMDGVAVNHNVTTDFTDVKKGEYYTGYVKWGSDNGIVYGTSKTAFSPNENITREQMCALMVRYADYAEVELKAVNQEITFLDAKNISSYAKKAVKLCQIGGIVRGEKTAGGFIFRPAGRATRAEAATIFERFDKMVKAQAVCIHTVTKQVVDRAATCGEEGLAHLACDACGEAVQSGIVLPATGNHTPAEEIITVIPATCGEIGIGKKVCSVCGQNAETGIVIPATGNHTPSETVITLIPATCGKEGVGEVKCAVCTVTLENNVPIAATGNHLSFTETTEKEMKALQDGLKRYTCNEPSCNYTYTEVIPASKSVKILAIGNSFSMDAVEHLWGICKDGGAEEIIIANLYIGGCTLDTHWNNIQNNKTAYTYYKTTDGIWKQTASTSLATGLADEDWDIITVQQASGSSGKPATYGNLTNILNYINDNKTNRNAKVYWHMTWAYQSDSTHVSFPNYDSNQQTMYNAIVSTVQSTILPYDTFSGIIPTGTAVQNLRSSYLGDTLTRDGYHLNYGVGRYLAGMSWYAYLAGGDVDAVDWVPAEYPEIEKHLPAIREAVKNAIATPFAPTNSIFDKPPVASDSATFIEAESAITSGQLTTKEFVESAANIYNGTSYVAISGNGKALVGNNPQIGATMDYELTIDRAGSYRLGLIMGLNSTQTEDVADLLEISVSSDGGEHWTACPIKVDAKTTGEGEQLNFFYAASDAENLAYTVELPQGKVLLRLTSLKSAEYYMDKLVLIPEEVTFALDDVMDHYGIFVYDSEKYVEAKLNITVGACYQSNSTANPVMSLISNGSRSPYFVATQIFTRETLPPGSIIVVDEGYGYRPDGWQKMEHTSSRPDKVTEHIVVVDEAWWGDYNYRGFNIYHLDDSIATAATGTHFKIYIPKEYDLSNYTQVVLEPTLKAYYNSSSQKYPIMGLVTTLSNSKQYVASQIFTRETLPIGSIIVVDAGYNYRPDGWFSKDSYPTSRPDVVRTNFVVVDEEWWGSYQYRGFNIAHDDKSTVTEDTVTHFRIYVPKK